MGYYPVFLELRDRPCGVIGGGVVAERKVEALVSAGARVTVVSPTLTPALQALADAGRVRHVGREYRAGDLAGQQLAFVATDDGVVNAAVAAEARERGVWLNAADDPRHCSFILPSVLRRGPLQVAVATGGASPALSRAIREELEAYFTEEYGALAALAAEVRQELAGSPSRPGATAWGRALAPDLRRLLADGQRDEAKARLLARLEVTAWQ
jgi:siroheme synthase-like protein